MPVVKFADTLEKGKERLKAINRHFEDQCESLRTLLREREEALKRILHWAGTEYEQEVQELVTRVARHQGLNSQPSVPRLEPRLVKNRTLAHGMGLSGLKTLKILNPQISLKLLSLEKRPIPPYQELALHSLEDNSKPPSLQGEVVPQDEPLPSLLATRSIIRVKSQDVPTRGAREGGKGPYHKGAAGPRVSC